MATNIETIRRILQGKRKLDVPGDWLEACVAWVQEENEVNMGLPLNDNMVFYRRHGHRNVALGLVLCRGTHTIYEVPMPL